MNPVPFPLPERIRLAVGELPPPGTLPASYPFGTMEPHEQGFVETNGVKVWYGVFGASGPWLCFAPLNQIATITSFKASVPYLSTMFRVVVMDLPGTGKSDRPNAPQAYGLDQYLAHFGAVLDHLGVDTTILIAISVSTLLALRFAVEQPHRVSRLIIAGGYAESLAPDAASRDAVAKMLDAMRTNWPGHLDAFWSSLFTEPHSTKAFEDGVHFSCATSGDIVALTRAGWLGHDVRELASRVTCPTLVIHGDSDKRVPYAKGRSVADLVPGATMLTIGGGGHLTVARDPVAFNRAVKDFAQPPRVDRQWTRGMARKPKALFISSPIGLGHVQRDLAIAREMRKLRPELEIDWFTVDPAARYLVNEGERLHPMTSRLANESRHFESVAGEHDLQAFFALRTMDEIMARNFMTFTDLVDSEHYDIVVGDEAWDVDYFYHENPELKRQPFVFLTDFVGSLPMSDDERENYLCADRNADDIEHIARYPWIRDRSIFIGNPEDLPDQTFGPGLPHIAEWTRQNFCFSGYALPFDPNALADTDRLRTRHGYRHDEKLVIAAIGGTAVGRPLLQRIAAAFPRMKRQLPELRMILVAGPRLAAEAFPEHDGLEIRPYVHNLFEHLACSDLALVQGGLSTCMELVATRRRFLSFPLERHFEQCIHVRNRLHNYCADCSVNFRDLLPDDLADRALAAMHAPVNYRPVETDGALRAAEHIVRVMENRHWAAA
jgi:pimeloyl-ACP methyl ester carboxylesterase/predicted glycosyltransferase